MEEIKNSFLQELSLLKESEDHIEFKEAKRNFSGMEATTKIQGNVGTASLDMWQLLPMRKVEGWCSE